MATTRTISMCLFSLFYRDVHKILTKNDEVCIRTCNYTEASREMKAVLLLFYWCCHDQNTEARRIAFSESILDSSNPDADLACEDKEDGNDVCIDSFAKAGSVEIDCSFDLRVGLWPETSHAHFESRQEEYGPALLLRYHKNKEIQLEPHLAEKSRKFQKSRTPIICEYDNQKQMKTRLSGNETSPGPILLMVANTIEYLWRLWPYFVHKVQWAESIGLRLVIWIGELPIAIAQTVTEECRSSELMMHFFKHEARRQAHHLTSTDEKRKLKRRRVTGNNRGESFYQERSDLTPLLAYSAKGSSVMLTKELNSNHHIKLLSTYAVLRFLSPKVSAVMYLDLDSVLDQSTDGVEEHLLEIQKHKKIDVFFEQTREPHFFWQVKSRTYFIRDTLFGRRFIIDWLNNRCGFKDQFSLWHTILKTAASANCLHYNNELLHLSYQDARTPSLVPPNAQVYRKTCQRRCPDFPFDCSNTYALNIGIALPAHHVYMGNSSSRQFWYFDPGASTLRSFFVENMLGTTDGLSETEANALLLQRLHLVLS